MAGPIAKLYATLGLDAREFTKGVDTAQKKTQSFVSSFKSSAMAGLGLGAGLGAVGVAAIGVSKAFDLVGDAIGAAIEEEASIAQLTRAIEANDEAWDGNMDAIADVIDSREQLAYADDELRDSLQRLVTVTGDTAEAFRLQGVAMDLARGRGMDLATASDAIAKVYAGNFVALRKMGIVLDENATATEYLAEVQRRYAGQASVFAETTAGKFARAQVEMANAMEDLGLIMTPLATGLADLAAEVLPDIAAAIAAVREEIQPLFDEFGPAPSLFDEWADKAREAGQAAGLSSVEIQQLVEDMLELDTAMQMNVEGIREASTEQERAIALQAMIESRMKAGAAAIEVSTAATDDLTDKTEALTTAVAKAINQSDRLADALQAVASVSLTDVRDEFRSVTKAAEQAAKSSTWATLNKQYDDLRRARARYMDEGEFDAVAIIDAAIAENREQARQRRLVSLQYRAEAGDRKAIQRLTEQGISIARSGADGMVEGNRRQQSALRRTQGEIEDVIGRVRELQAAAAEGATVDVLVDQSELDAAIAKLDRLRGFTSAGATTSVTTPVPASAVQSNGITINGNVYGGKAGTRQLAGELDKATRPTNRYRRHNNTPEG
jgi:nitrogen fixation-related uncharacterized protein